MCGTRKGGAQLCRVLQTDKTTIHKSIQPTTRVTQKHEFVVNLTADVDSKFTICEVYTVHVVV